MKVGVIGGGAWGTGLSTAVVRAGNSVLVWVREQEIADGINQMHETPYLSDVKLDFAIVATNDLSELQYMDLLLFVVPSRFSRGVLKEMAKWEKCPSIVMCTKGIEANTAHFMADVVREELPDVSVAVLGGPQFAGEVAQGMETWTMIAAKDKKLNELAKQAVDSDNFHVVLSDDVVGVQLCGAGKNVVALAVGYIAGAGGGENARAGQMALAWKEIVNLGLVMGAKMETFLDIPGLGDLVLSATSVTGRNYLTGFMLGQGKTMQQIHDEKPMLSEGVEAIKAILILADRYKIDMPIIRKIGRLIHG